jgi:hypothetical protein
MSSPSSTLNALHPLFRVGDIIKMDNKDNVYITHINDINNIISFNVKYLIGGHIDSHIELDRISPISATISSNRSGITRHYSASSQLQQSSNNTSTAAVSTPRSTPFIQLQEALKASRSWTPPSSSSSISSSNTSSTSLSTSRRSSSSSSSSIHPMYLYLKKNKDKEKGWLRQMLPFKDDEKKTTQSKRDSLTYHYDCSFFWF